MKFLKGNKVNRFKFSQVISNKIKGIQFKLKYKQLLKSIFFFCEVTGMRIKYKFKHWKI